MSGQGKAGGRARGRPPHSAGAVITREGIAGKALEIAGAEGFSALSMHRLARELGVTPKALYHHVRDRQDVVDAVAALMLQEVPEPRLDITDWRASLREAYREARQVYRRFPRALLISLDETVTPARVDPQRILLAENMLRFFVDIGLTLEQAVAARSAFLVDAWGFVLTTDYRYDTGGEAIRAATGQPVPDIWLAAHPEIAAPLSREAAALPSPSSDQLFEMFVELRISAIEALRTTTG